MNTYGVHFAIAFLGHFDYDAVYYSLRYSSSGEDLKT